MVDTIQFVSIVCVCVCVHVHALPLIGGIQKCNSYLFLNVYIVNWSSSTCHIIASTAKYSVVIAIHESK
jgi:hypothetical protein